MTASSAAISPSRTVHISKLPSSALLGSSIRASLKAQVRVIDLKLSQDPTTGRDFLARWNDVTTTGDALEWDLYQTVEDETRLFVVVRLARAQEPSSPSADVTPSGLPVVRKSSGMLNVESPLEGQLTRWLGATQHLLARPTESSSASILLSCGNKAAVAGSKINFLEIISVKPGQESSFSDFCRMWMISKNDRDENEPPNEPPALSSSPKAADRLGEMSDILQGVFDETKIQFSYELMQDLGQSTVFRIMYTFSAQGDVVKVRNSNAWRNWRRRVAAFLQGSPAIFNLRKIIDSTQISDEKAGARIVPSRTAESRIEEPLHHDVGLSAESDVVGKRAVAADGKLADYTEFIRTRFEAYQKRKKQLGSLITFADAHREMGITQHAGKVQRIREFLPGAKTVKIAGDFNEWNAESHQLTREGGKDNDPSPYWSLDLPEIKHLQRYKLIIEGADGEVRELPSVWTKLAWRSGETNQMESVVYLPREPYQFEHSLPAFTESIRAYEVHVGCCIEKEKVASYRDCESVVLPRMKALGFNTLVLTAIQEHSYYTSAGWHVTSFFAPTSSFGSPEELKHLIDTAHQLRIKVIVTAVLGHASPSATESFKLLDGTESGAGFLHVGNQGKNPLWDALVFDFSNEMTLKFHMSCLAYWLQEFNVDGFRFEGISGMLYKDKGANGGFDLFKYETYFTANADVENQVVLMLMNDLIHSIRPAAITIGNDICMTPTMGLSILNGGLGFDYVIAENQTDAFSRLVDQFDYPDIDRLRWQLDPVNAEKRLSVAETLETTLVGKRPLRVAFFAWETLHTIAVGGIAPHVTELAAGLRRCGHELHVFTRAAGAVPNVTNHYGVYYHEVTFALCRDFVQECANMCGAFVSAMLEHERNTGDSFDLIHGHDWLAARAVTALKGLGRTAVFTMHSTEAGRCGNQVYGGDSERIRQIEREACERADRVICVSGVLADEVKGSYGIHGEKIRVVYNGCNVQNFDGFEDAGPIKQSLGISAMDPTILFVGRFVMQKGVDLLVEAIPAILNFRNDVKFVIVGDGHMRQEVQNRANHLGVGHAMRFVGTKSGAELKSLFKMCDAVIVPSRNEPFGIVVLEAWSAYKPVIATTCGGPRDFVTPDVDGFLVDPAPPSIVWGVCQTLKDFDHAKWMGERGRVKAAYSFSWDTIAMQTRDIYYELINRHDAPYLLHNRGGSSLAMRAMGEAMYFHMGIFDNDSWVGRGLAALRIVAILSMTFGGSGSMVPMGAELAHPDWLDLPRAGNNLSHFHARRQWSLSLNKELKFKHMQFLYAVLNRLDSITGVCSSPHRFVVKCQAEDCVLCYERGDCLVVANLHPDRSYEDYGIGHSLPSSVSGDMVLVMDSDEARFGGWNRLEGGGKSAIYPSCNMSMDNRDKSIKVYLPARCILILVPVEVFQVKHIKLDPIMADGSPDRLIDELLECCSAECNSSKPQ